MPAATTIEMRSAWGELQLVEVMPVALGRSNERIGDELGVSMNTVRTHLANLRAKLDAETRLEAVMAGLRLGLLELR